MPALGRRWAGAGPALGMRPSCTGAGRRGCSVEPFGWIAADEAALLRRPRCPARTC